MNRQDQQNVLWNQAGFFWNNSFLPSATSSVATVNVSVSPITVVITGAGTKWTTSTVFSVAGGVGTKVISSVVDPVAQTASVVLVTGLVGDSLIISNSTDIAIAILNTTVPLPTKDTCNKTEPPKRGFSWSPLTDCPPVNV